MSRRLTVLAAAVLASLAFAAIPAIASANVELYEGSTKLAVGSSIATHSIGKPQIMNGSGTLIMSCTDVKFTGTVNRNEVNGFRISLSQAKFTGTGSEGRCEAGGVSEAVSIKTPACWNHFVTMGEYWEMASASCGFNGAVGLTIASSFGLTCTYSSETGGFDLVHASLDPLQLKTPRTQWFNLTAGGFACQSKVGIAIPTLEVTNGSGGKLKEIHT